MYYQPDQITHRMHCAHIISRQTLRPHMDYAYSNDPIQPMDGKSWYRNNNTVALTLYLYSLKKQPLHS